MISYLVIGEAFTDNGGLDVRFVKLPMKLQKHQAYVVQVGGTESFGHGGKGRGHGCSNSRTGADD